MESHNRTTIKEYVHIKQALKKEAKEDLGKQERKTQKPFWKDNQLKALIKKKTNLTTMARI